MKIEKYLKRVRIFLLKRKFYRLFLWSIILVSASLFVMIQLESIFYFHPKVKSLFLTLLCTVLVLEGTFGLIYFWKAKQDKISYYKLDVIASSLGKRVFQKGDDLILNALQLENGIVDNESTVLANSYIEEINQRLKSVSLNDYFKKDKLNQIKSTLLIVWTGILCVFILNYESSSNAFSRMINPSEVFYAPKPFSLLSMSGDIHILSLIHI